ncbi:MAG: hypothetical protein DMG57_25895 [Acidobacteria bacterium]|nr:MAG: hypothetical protein DMG57_25895 [Acidobacteriota bacterium]
MASHMEGQSQIQKRPRIVGRRANEVPVDRYRFFKAARSHQLLTLMRFRCQIRLGARGPDKGDKAHGGTCQQPHSLDLPLASEWTQPWFE